MALAIFNHPAVDLTGSEQLFALAVVRDFDAPQVPLSGFNTTPIPESEPVAGFVVKNLAERNDVTGPPGFVKHLIAHLYIAHLLPASGRR